MNIDEFQQLAKKRRSYRRFKPDPVPDEFVQKILETARWAPSGANAQPWEFMVIRDQKTKDAITKLYLDVRPEHYYIEQTRKEDLRHNNLQAFPKDTPGFKDAPVIILVLGDRRTFQASVLAGVFIGAGGTVDSTYQKGMANVTLMMHLSVAALGLASQWVSVQDDWAALLRPLLGIPPFMHIHHLVPVGYPAHEAKTPYRRKVAEMVHYEKYDMSKYRSGEQIVDYIRQLRGSNKAAYDLQKAPKGNS